MKDDILGILKLKFILVIKPIINKYYQNLYYLFNLNYKFIYYIFILF